MDEKVQILTILESARQSLLDYADAAKRTEEVIAGLPDLDTAHKLPEAPWYPPDTAWSAREVLLHLLHETAQHARHADIIKETLVAD